MGGFPSQLPDTDLNGDGIWDLRDISIFVSVFTGGAPESARSGQAGPGGTGVRPPGILSA